LSQFLVYHAWEKRRTARRMCIDPLPWTAKGARCVGPTTAVKPSSLLARVLEKSQMIWYNAWHAAQQLNKLHC